MKRIVLIALLLLVAGCSLDRNESVTDSKQLYQDMRDRFYSQESYAFDGTFRRLTDTSKELYGTIFTGRVNNRYDVLIRVDEPENAGTAKEYAVLTIDGLIYEKLERETGWKKIADGNPDVRWKMQIWNPVTYFQIMDNWQQAIRPLSLRPPVSLPLRENQDDHLEAFRVILDSERVTPWLINRLRAEGEDVNAEDLRRVNAYTDVYVNTKENLPTSIVMHVHSDRISGGDIVREQREYTFYFRNYGESFELPEIAKKIVPEEKQEET